MEELNKILIVSKSAGTAEQISMALPEDPAQGLSVETTTFEGMNGHAIEMAQSHNILIFDANPEDEDELSAIRAMLAERQEGAFYVALTDEDVSIAKARRLRDAGIDEVLPNTISKGELHELVERTIKARKAAQARPVSASTHEGTVISVAQARGGIGSTTVAVNIARKMIADAGFLKKGEKPRVALIDLDLQFGNANVFLDLEDNGGFLRLLELDVAPDASYLHGVMQKHPSGIEVLSAPQPIAPLHTVHAEDMVHLFDLAKAEFDFVIVDLPHALVEWVEPVLARTNKLVMVMDTTVPCVRQAKRLVDFYREANIAMEVEYVVNHEAKPFMRSDAQREAENVLETKFHHWIPDNQKIARKAVDLGRPVAEIGSGSDMGKAIRKLAAALKEAPVSKSKSA